MKAFLLAAGLGTRLRPLTNTTPKCLVPINGIPLLEYWLYSFRKYDIDEILINTNYLHEQVHNYINNHNSNGIKPFIVESYEPELIGSGGTVSANRDFVKNEDDFFICYADNLTNIDLKNMYDFHKKNNSSFTMGLFRSNNPKECGIATVKDDLIIDFIEKPEFPKSNLSNAGIYIANNSLFDYLPKDVFCDFGKEILPKLVNKMYGYEICEFLQDIGTINGYERAQKEAPDVFKEAYNEFGY